MTGAPVVLGHSIAYLETEVIDMSDSRTHTIFIGKVIDAEVMADGEPMTYAYYHEIKKGKSPKTAPTYIKERNKKEV